jgi:nitrogen fixation/metabolism regulation signal transduction histidine kinase
MDSRLLTPGGFAFGIAWRSLATAGLVFALLQVLSATQYYATALVLAGAIALLLLSAAQFYARLGALAPERHALPRAQARQLDHLDALLDAVTVALIAMGPDGRISLVNRAARLLAGEDVARLEDIRALGAEAAARIAALPPGARQIVAGNDGRLLLVWITGFTAPGLPPQRLVSLQAVAGALDAVQLKAWQDMSRVLSHEIMNSLTPIASLSESVAGLLRGEGARPDLAEAAETIGRRSRHLMDFVDRYRQIADLPAPRPQAIALKRFVADLDALAGAQMSGQGITYRSEIAAGLAELRADPELLAQALINLLRNAAEAAGKGGAVALSCLDHGGDIVFHVRDNGPGLSDEQLEDIFVPFFTTKPGGRGIGLTLARQIALAHGGDIEARRAAPQGMVFSMKLPNPA